MLLRNLMAGGGGGSSAYYDAVMADSPAFYLRLNETSGGTAADSSGNARSGNYVSSDASSLTSAGLLDSSADKGILSPGTGFNGITVATTAVATNADWTVECLIKPTGTPPGSSAVGMVATVHGAGGSPGYPEISLIETTAGSKFRLRVMRGSNSEIFRSTTEYSYNTRLHVVLSYKFATGALTLYINNVVDGTATNTYGNFNADHGIGYDFFNNGYPFKGYMDEVAYYASTLSAARVAAHYAAI